MPLTQSIGLDTLAKYFHLPINDVAKELGVCATVLKKICRKNGIPRWPHRKIKSLDKMIATLDASVGKNPEDEERIRQEIQTLKNKRTFLMKNPNVLAATKPSSLKRNKSGVRYTSSGDEGNLLAFSEAVSAATAAMSGGVPPSNEADGASLANGDLQPITTALYTQFSRPPHIPQAVHPSPAPQASFPASSSTAAAASSSQWYGQEYYTSEEQQHKSAFFPPNKQYLKQQIAYQQQLLAQHQLESIMELASHYAHASSSSSSPSHAPPSLSPEHPSIHDETHSVPHLTHPHQPAEEFSIQLPALRIPDKDKDKPKLSTLEPSMFSSPGSPSSSSTQHRDSPSHSPKWQLPSWYEDEHKQAMKGQVSIVENTNTTHITKLESNKKQEQQTVTSPAS